MARAEKRAPKERRKAPGRPFVKGKSGNPAGRPKGALSRTTRLAAALLEGEAEALARKAVALALGGDVTALRVCLERLIPPARERALMVSLPAVATAADLPTAVARVIDLVATGEITPGEGSKLVELLDGWRSALEMSEIEARLVALEGRR